MNLDTDSEFLDKVLSGDHFDAGHLDCHICDATRQVEVLRELLANPALRAIAKKIIQDTDHDR